MLFKLISDTNKIGSLKFSYQQKSEFTKELESLGSNGKKFYNVTSEKIDGGLEVALAIGDQTLAENVDAWVIPNFDYKVSEGGVAKTVLKYAKNIGEEQVVTDARKVYQDIVDNGTNFGYAHVISGFENKGPKAFMHVVTAEVPSDVAHDMIAEATYQALMTADAAGIESIAFPALNTGASSSFSTPQESAEAMMQGIHQFINAKDGKQVTNKILIVSYQKDDKGKLMSRKQIIDYSRAQKKTDDKIAIKSYGPEAHYSFIETLYGKLTGLLRRQGDLKPEFSVAKKIVFDLLEDVGGIFFNILDAEEAKQLKLDISSKLLQAAEANPEVALSKNFIKEFIRSISEIDIDEAEFDKAIEDSVARYKQELDIEVRKLENVITTVNRTIETQVKTINERSQKKVDKNSPRFGQLNDKANKARDFIDDCNKLRSCVDRITKKIIDEAEFNEMQAKYQSAIGELKKQARQSDDTIQTLNQRLQHIKTKFDTLENELEKERLKQQRAQQRQPVHSPTYRSSQ